MARGDRGEPIFRDDPDRQQFLTTLREHVERIVAEELIRRRWNERDLERHAQGGASKVMIAMRLRREPEVTVALATRK